jgi:hypothetical protein
MNRRFVLTGVFLLSISGAAPALAQNAAQTPFPSPMMTFFVTSVGMGKGGDLGGLAGADKHCQDLAAAVGAGNHTWHAYLSASAVGGAPAVNARDRIGQGPWYSFKGVQIAANVADLHGDTLDSARIGNAVSRLTALAETGERMVGAGNPGDQHDMLTGTRPDGAAYPADANLNCKNWTSSSPDDNVQVGHPDRAGGPNISWNSAQHVTGCAQEKLVADHGKGQFYCFAADAH